MISGIHHTGITVSDWDRSMKFYCDVLGMENVWEVEFDNHPQAQAIHALQNEKFRVAFLAIPADLGGGKIELFHFTSPKGEPRRSTYRVCDHGWTHVCFTTSDIEKTYQELSAQGVRFTTPPLEVKMEGVKIIRDPQTETAPTVGRVRATYFYDPDGLIMELIQL